MNPYTIGAEFDNMSAEEYILILLARAQSAGLRLYSITLESNVFHRLEMNLGSRVKRTKKGHIKLFAGIPHSYEVIIKRNKRS